MKLKLLYIISLFVIYFSQLYAQPDSTNINLNSTQKYEILTPLKLNSLLQPSKIFKLYTGEIFSFNTDRKSTSYRFINIQNEWYFFDKADTSQNKLKSSISETQYDKNISFYFKMGRIKDTLILNSDKKYELTQLVFNMQSDDYTRPVKIDSGKNVIILDKTSQKYLFATLISLRGEVISKRIWMQNNILPLMQVIPEQDLIYNDKLLDFVSEKSFYTKEVFWRDSLLNLEKHLSNNYPDHHFSINCQIDSINHVISYLITQNQEDDFLIDDLFLPAVVQYEGELKISKEYYYYSLYLLIFLIIVVPGVIFLIIQMINRFSIKRLYNKYNRNIQNSLSRIKKKKKLGKYRLNRIFYFLDKREFLENDFPNVIKERTEVLKLGEDEFVKLTNILDNEIRLCFFFNNMKKREKIVELRKLVSIANEREVIDSRYFYQDKSSDADNRTLQTINNQINTINSAIKDTNKELGIIKNSLGKSKEENILTVKAEIKKLQVEQQEKDKSIKQLDEKNKKLDKSLNDLHGEIEKLNKVKNELNEQLRLKSEELSSKESMYEAEKQILKTENDVYKEDFVLFENEGGDYRTDLVEQFNGLANLINELFTSVRKVSENIRIPTEVYKFDISFTNSYNQLFNEIKTSNRIYKKHSLVSHLLRKRDEITRNEIVSLFLKEIKDTSIIEKYDSLFIGLQKLYKYEIYTDLGNVTANITEEVNKIKYLDAQIKKTIDTLFKINPLNVELLIHLDEAPDFCKAINSRNPKYYYPLAKISANQVIDILNWAYADSDTGEYLKKAELIVAN